MSTRRSRTTAVVVAIVSIAACFCVISTLTSSTFVHATTVESDSNNSYNNIDNSNFQAEDGHAFQDQDLADFIGKGQVFGGSAVSEEDEEEGEVEGGGVGGAVGEDVGMGSPDEIDSGRLAGSIIRQPAAAAGGGGDKDLEGQDDLEGLDDLEGQEDMDLDVEVVKGEEPTADSSKEGALSSIEVGKKSSTILTHRTSKLKHKHHQGHVHGHQGQLHGKKGVHRHGRHHGHIGKKHGHPPYPGKPVGPRHGQKHHRHRHHKHKQHAGPDHNGGKKKSHRVKYPGTKLFFFVFNQTAFWLAI